MQAGLDELRKASFKNFHAKGLDYICLKRTPRYTVKIYILDGDLNKLPEVVCPHDHRYDFRTEVIAGEMIDFQYGVTIGEGVPHTHMEWRTPLLGGGGFTAVDNVRLMEIDRVSVMEGERLFSPHQRIHTIRPMADQTILLLEQFEDEMPEDQATWTFIPGHDADKPPLDGLYEEFTEGEFMDKLNWLRNRSSADINGRRRLRTHRFDKKAKEVFRVARR